MTLFSSRKLTPAFTTGALCALALMLRACFGGIRYLPILDDSIQYINYPTSLSFSGLIAKEGLFASRPLAGIIDLFVIGPLHGHCLILPVLVISALYGAAAGILYDLFRRCFGVSPVFAVTFALLPLGCEGTYWLSASSRIALGLFFCAMAAHCLDRFTSAGKWRSLIGFILFLLLSFSLYEQILVVSFTLVCLMGLRFLARRERRGWAALLVLPAAGAYFAFTASFAAQGSLGSRMATVFPTKWEFYRPYAEDVIRQIGAAFLRGGWRTLAIGFVRGIGMCFSGFGGILFFCAVLILVFLAAFGIHAADAAERPIPHEHPWAGPLVWGFLLALAPVTPFFILENPNFTLRAAVPSFIGVSLLIDAAVRACLRRPGLCRSAAAVMVGVFLIAGASEVADYQAAARYDNDLAETILQQDEGWNGRIGIFGFSDYPTAQNFAYRGHIAAVCESEWSLYGKLVAVTGAEQDFTPVPLETDGFCFYHGWNLDAKRLRGFDALYLYDGGRFIPLTAQPRETGENDFRLLLPDGSLYADVWEEEDNGDLYGYIRIAPIPEK